MTKLQRERAEKLAAGAHTKWMMFLNPDPDDTDCPQAPSEVYLEAFNEGYAAGLADDDVRALVEALKKNKSEWEAVSPEGHKNYVAWQVAKEVLARFSDGSEG